MRPKVISEVKTAIRHSSAPALVQSISRRRVPWPRVRRNRITSFASQSGPCTRRGRDGAL